MSTSKDTKLAACGRGLFILKIADPVRRSLIMMAMLGLAGCGGLAEQRFPPPEPAAPPPPPERAPPPAVEEASSNPYPSAPPPAPASTPPPAVEEQTSSPRPAGTSSRDEELPPGGQANRGTSGPGSYKLDLLPLISFDRPPQIKSKTRIVPGSYVRLVVDGDEHAYEAGGANAGEPIERRHYSNEHRSWLKRWAVGLSNSKVLTLQVTLSNPAVTVSVPLASASFSSNRKDGESWSTELDPKRSLTPYFKVSPTVTLSLKADLQATSKIVGM